MKLDNILWRKTENGSLFPRPLPSKRFQVLKKQTKDLHSPAILCPHDTDKVHSLFKMMGALIGRAILDERLLDLPLHPIFWDLVLDRVSFIA